MCNDIIKERPIATFDVCNLSNSMHKRFAQLKSTFCNHTEIQRYYFQLKNVVRNKDLKDLVLVYYNKYSAPYFSK